MVGSPNYVRFVYDGDGSDTPAGPARTARGSIEQMFIDYFGSQGPRDRADRVRRPVGLRPVHRGRHPGRRPVHRRRGHQDRRAGRDVRRHGRRAVRPLLPPGVRHARKPEPPGAVGVLGRCGGRDRPTACSGPCRWRTTRSSRSARKKAPQCRTRVRRPLGRSGGPIGVAEGVPSAAQSAGRAATKLRSADAALRSGGPCPASTICGSRSARRRSLSRLRRGSGVKKDGG